MNSIIHYNFGDTKYCDALQIYTRPQKVIESFIIDLKYDRIKTYPTSYSIKRNEMQLSLKIVTKCDNELVKI